MNAEAWTPRSCPWWHWPCVLLIGVAATAPYLDKAFHIDDVLYLRVADQIRRTPLDPYSGVVLWDAADGQPSSLFMTDFNPPLWKYVLAGVMTVWPRPARELEISLHLASAAATLVAAFGVYQFSRRFSRFPLWCTGMIVLGPFYLPGQNIMLEPSLLAWSCWAVEFQCRAWDRRGFSAWPLLAGLCAAAALLTKYTGGLLLPILFGGCWLRRRWGTAWFAAFPILALAAWIAFCIHTYGRSHFGAQGLSFEADSWHIRLLNVVRSVGSVTVLGPLLLLHLLAGFKARRVLVCIACMGVAGLLSVVDLMQAKAAAKLEGWGPSPLQSAHYVAFTLNGVWTMLAAASALLFNGRSGDNRAPFLLGWIAVLFVFNIACTPFNAIRHLLLLFVPLTWLVALLAEDLLQSMLVRAVFFGVSATLAGSLAAADYDFADSGRELAGRDLAPLVAERRAANGAVWFTGNWGFVHYSNLAGAFPWVIRPEQYGMPSIQPGDRLVHPVLLTWTDLDKPLPKGMAKSSSAHWQPQAKGGVTPTAILGQFLRTVAPGVNYYSVRRYALPWEILVRPAEAQERRSGMYFYLPTLGDVLVYEIVAAGRS